MTALQKYIMTRIKSYNTYSLIHHDTEYMQDMSHLNVCVYKYDLYMYFICTSTCNTGCES